MIQVSPNIWSWSEFNQEKQLDFNGWYIDYEQETVLIDPPAPNEDLLRFIETKGIPDVILLTNGHHVRSSEAFRELYECPIWVHENDENLIDIPLDRTFQSEDVLSCGLRVINLAHGKTKGESAFYFNANPPAMIVGDAVIGAPKGSLSMLPHEKLQNLQLAKESLNHLLEFPFELLLVGDGSPILHNAYDTLKRFLTDA